MSSFTHIQDDIEFFTEFPCLLGHPVYKETVNVLQTNPLVKTLHFRFTTVPFKPFKPVQK